MTSTRNIKIYLVSAAIFLLAFLFLFWLSPIFLSGSILKENVEKYLTSVFNAEVKGKRLSFSFFPKFGLQLDQVVIASKEPRFGDFAQIESLFIRQSIVPALFGVVEAQNITVQSARFVFQWRGEIRNWPDKNPIQTALFLSDPTSDGTEKPGFPKEITFENSRLVFTEITSGVTEVVDQLNGYIFINPDIKVMSVDVDFSWRGESVEFIAKLANYQTEKNLLKLGKLSLAVKSYPVNLDYHGSFTDFSEPVFDGAISGSSPNVPWAAIWLSLPLPDNTIITAGDISGTIRSTPSQINIDDLYLTIDGNRGHGGMTLKRNLSRIALGGTLDFARIDVTRYMPKLFEQNDFGEPVYDSKLFSPEFLLGVDLDLRLSATEMVYENTRFENAAISFHASEGIAKVDIASLSKGENRFLGVLEMNFNETPYQTDIKFKLTGKDNSSVPITSRLSLNSIQDFIVSGTLNSRGNSISDLADNLSGKLDFDFHNIEYQGVPIDAVFNIIKRQNIDFSELKKTTTLLERLYGQLDFDSAYGEFSRAEAILPMLKADITGSVDIFERKIDVLLSFQQRKQQTDLADGQSAQMALKLKGSIFNPDLLLGVDF